MVEGTGNSEELLRASWGPGRLLAEAGLSEALNKGLTCDPGGSSKAPHKGGRLKTGILWERGDTLPTRSHFNTVQYRVGILDSPQCRGQGRMLGPLAGGTRLGLSGGSRHDLRRGRPVESMGVNETRHGP